MDAPAPREIARLARPEPGFREFVIMVALMMAITAFAVDSILPAFPNIGAAFAVPEPNSLQLVVYVYMLGFGLSQLIYGPAADIFGRRPAYLAGLAIFIVGCALSLFATDLATLLASRFVQGLGAGSGRVIAMTIVRDRYSGREMARLMSLTSIVFITVPVFAPAIGTLVLAVAGWREIFGAMLLLGIALGAWFIIRMPETLAPANRMAPSAAPVISALKATVASRPTVGYATAFGLLFGCIMGMVGSSQQIFAELYGLGSLFPVAFGSIAAVMGLAAFVNSRIVRRLGMHRISHAAILAYAACALVQLGVALAFAGQPPLLLLGLTLAGCQFTSSLCLPNFNALAMEPLGRIAGTASSLIGLYTTVLGAFAGLLVGQAFNGTVIPLAIGFVVLAAASIGAVLWTERGRLFRPRHPDPPLTGD